jgi:hypothetical protein
MVNICGDSRHFTSYIPNCDLEKQLAKAANTKDSYSYRQFLQSNGQVVAASMTPTELRAKYPLGCTCNKRKANDKPFK